MGQLFKGYVNVLRVKSIWQISSLLNNDQLWLANSGLEWIEIISYVLGDTKGAYLYVA